MLEHGGRRRAAARQFGIPEADWLDLSTGINPAGYPVPPIPDDVWNRLPEDDDGLLAAAARCYGSDRLVVLAGSQIAIQSLPWLVRRGRVGVLAPCYAEHAHHWTRAGHDVVPVIASALVDAANGCDVLVLCNPNNPDGRQFEPDVLLAVARALADRDGLLVVDEAFGDATPALSLASLAGGPQAPNVVVLRSLGKFYGLAGARVGFAIASPARVEALREMAGPWPVSGPARFVAQRALADTAWQASARDTLWQSATRLAALLAPLATFDGPPVATALFVWLPVADPLTYYTHFARQGILVRQFPEFMGLRFGLPGDATAWRRLAAAVETLR